MKVLSSRQEQIVKITIKIISEKGIQNLTMKNIASELGISEPAIYRHFESKQKILIAVLNSFNHQTILENENLSEEGETAFQYLQRLIKLIMNKFTKNPAMYAVIFSEEIFQNHSKLLEMIRNILNFNIAFFTDILGKGQKDGSIRLDIKKEDLGIIVMGSIRHIITIWRLSEFTINLDMEGEKLIKSLKILIAT